MSVAARTPASLEVRDVTIRYGKDVAAVRNLSLTLVPGEVFGLVGPNGAGKSSLLNCAAGLIAPNSGAIFADSEDVSGDPQRAARRVVLMPDPLGVYLDVTAFEYMRFFARAYGLSKQVSETRIVHAVDRLGLAPWLDHEVETLSAGWQRRLALTRVLIADAPIVLLDEPAAGLDVSGRRDLLRLVRGFASEGRAVLVTSHILPELEELADRFGIIRSGQWLSVREGQPFFTRSELRAGFTEGFYRLECSEPAVACASLGVERAQLEPDGERIRLVASSRDDAASLVEQLMRAGHKIYHLEAGGRSLDDVTLAALDDRSHP